MKTYAIRSAILSLIVNLAFLWLVNDALAIGMAPDYYTISVGQTKLNRNTGFGWWNQSSSDQIYSETNPSWALRGGWDVSKHIAIEVGFRDLGRFNTAGSFISDTAYTRISNGQCSFPCGENAVSIVGEGRVYGADLRLKIRHDLGFTYLPEMSVYGALGIFAYHSTYNFWRMNQDNSGKLPQIYHSNENRQRPSISIGIEYGKMFAEYTIDRHVGTELSAFNKAQTIHIGVRF